MIAQSPCEIVPKALSSCIVHINSSFTLQTLGQQSNFPLYSIYRSSHPKQHECCQAMSGTAENNADVRSAPITHPCHHKLSVSRTRALLAHKLAHFQTPIHPCQSAELDLLNSFVDSQRQPLNLKMHITDEEAAELKAWIVKKLENMYAELSMRHRPALD